MNSIYNNNILLFHKFSGSSNNKTLEKHSFNNKKLSTKKKSTLGYIEEIFKQVTNKQLIK